MIIRPSMQPGVDDIVGCVISKLILLSIHFIRHIVLSRTDILHFSQAQPKKGNFV